MISKKLPQEIIQLLIEIENQGFSLCLVGGAVRDFLRTGDPGMDLDFEIRSIDKNLKSADWENNYGKLVHFFKKKKFAVTQYPYLITCIKLGDYDLEFSSPRLEKQIPDNHTHHHFTAMLDSQLDYSQSFVRRDLTINALGIELHLSGLTEKMIDPFGGKSDLDQKILRHCSDDFFADPVRFLRLSRFAVKYPDFSIADETRKKLGQFNLSGVTIHYLKQESLKSKNCAAFFNHTNHLMKGAGLEITKELAVLFAYDYPENFLTLEQITAFAVCKNKEDGKKISRLFNLPVKFLKDVESFCQSWQEICLVEQEEITQLLKDGFDNCETDHLLKNLKNINEKNEFFYLVKYLSPPALNWTNYFNGEFPKPSADHLSTFSPTVRSYLKYYQKLKKEFSV